MKQTIETTETVTKAVEVTVCDRCGLEADDPVPLFRDVRREVFDNPGEAPMEYHSALAHNPRSLCKYEVPPETAYVIESIPDPLAEVCEDCYEEVFSWGDADV